MHMVSAHVPLVLQLTAVKGKDNAMSNGMPDSNPLVDLQHAARQLLNDIESMAAGSDFEFGEFSEWRQSDDGDGVMIAWPNLAISAARLREALVRSRS
jgi:hypothetical protein